MTFSVSAPWFSPVVLPQVKLTVTHQDQGIGSHRVAMGSAPGDTAAPENYQYPSASKLENRVRAVFRRQPSAGSRLRRLHKTSHYVPCRRQSEPRIFTKPHYVLPAWQQLIQMRVSHRISYAPLTCDNKLSPVCSPPLSSLPSDGSSPIYVGKSA